MYRYRDHSCNNINIHRYVYRQIPLWKIQIALFRSRKAPVVSYGVVNSGWEFNAVFARLKEALGEH